MRKRIVILCLLLIPVVSNAQKPAITFPYSCDCKAPSIRGTHWMSRMTPNPTCGHYHEQVLILGKVFEHEVWNDFCDRVEKFVDSIHLEDILPSVTTDYGICFAVCRKEEVDVTFLLLEAEQAAILSQKKPTK